MNDRSAPTAIKIKSLDAEARPLKPQTRVTAMPVDMLADCALDREDGREDEAERATTRAEG